MPKLKVVALNSYESGDSKFLWGKMALNAYGRKWWL